ncbi:hypothetical protein [Streptomyces sp. NBC_00557]|uniref:hypothetical protein n=1 Tax=Streptomyces sp. NBC_00557 TaxID=2975776 RepID=UPI002E81CC4A|nr:hypothetical protein [Streptomyces sp. NBC_00557]WUC37273.1 hypothetical protein OG956_25190 [Streptomyces sp. NBC_00557]
MLDTGGRRLGPGGEQNGPTRLGFSLVLRFFELEGRFPEFVEEIPPQAVEYVTELVKVPAADFVLVGLNPYGTFHLDMDKRLDLGLVNAVPRPRGQADADRSSAETR